jgi:hypothetical protein
VYAGVDILLYNSKSYAGWHKFFYLRLKAQIYHSDLILSYLVILQNKAQPISLIILCRVPTLAFMGVAMLIAKLGRYLLTSVRSNSKCILNSY